MLAGVIDRLEAHGVKYFLTAKESPFTGERFRIESSVLAQSEYQGTHKLRTLTGAWEATEQILPPGSLVVPMDQPLARLAFVLFDPRSDDGLMAWNILDAVLGAAPGSRVLSRAAHDGTGGEVASSERVLRSRHARNAARKVTTMSLGLADRGGRRAPADTISWDQRRAARQTRWRARAGLR